MEENDKYPEQGVGEAAGVWLIIQSCRPVGIALRCGGMGGYPPHGTRPGGVSIPGGAATDGAAAKSEVGWDMGVHLDGGGNIGGRVQADGELHSAKEEYGHSVYCDAANSGSM